MRVTSADLETRISFAVDPDAEPADLDAAVARFLLAMVRSPSCDASGVESTQSSDNSTSKTASHKT